MLHELLEPVISADSPAPAAGPKATDSSPLKKDGTPDMRYSVNNEASKVEASLRGAMAELPKDRDLTADDEPAALSPDSEASTSPQPSPPPSPAPSEGNAGPSTCGTKRILPTASPPAKRAC